MHLRKVNIWLQRNLEPYLSGILLIAGVVFIVAALSDKEALKAFLVGLLAL